MKGELGAGRGTLASSRMVESDGPKQPTAIDLVYQGNLTGRIASRQMTIDGGVNALQRSVVQFGEPIDVQRPGTPLVGDVTLQCRQIGVAADPALVGRWGDGGASTPWEVTAAGAVRLRNHAKETVFQVDADRCSYATSKGLLTLSGTSTQPAQLTGLDATGRSKGGMSADYLILNVETMTIDSEMRGMTVAAPPERVRGRTR